MRSLIVGIAITIAGATAVRVQNRDTVIFGLPIYNGDEAVKKQCEEAASKPAVSKSACMAAEALQEKDARDELAKIWNSLDSSIRLQCITNRSVDSYSGLKQCIEHVVKRERGRYRQRGESGSIRSSQNSPSVMEARRRPDSGSAPQSLRRNCTQRKTCRLR
jgi:hypothetical protein